MSFRCTNFKLTDVPVLDVGLGTGKALAGMQVFYRCNAVGLEVCPSTFAGSVHYLSYLEQKLGYLPIRPIKGDALKIDHFWKWMNYLLLVKRFFSRIIEAFELVVLLTKFKSKIVMLPSNFC